MTFNHTRNLCLFFFIIVGSLSELNAQSYSRLNWYFGNTTNSLRFIRPDLQAESITIPNALGTGGSAVVINPATGALLFYTDGQVVYDATDTQTPNGNGLNGTTTLNQGVVICANPALANEYFIFTISGTGLLERSVMDMSANGNGPGFPSPPLGDITTKNDGANLPGSPRSTGLIIIPNAARDGFWIISHEAGTNNYDVTQIDNLGIITTLATTPLPGAPTSVANFSYNAATDQIAVSSMNPAEEAAVLSIDPTTGALALVTTIAGTDASGLGAENIYDIEWSNNGQFLYLSGNFGGAQDALMQVDLTEAPPVLRPLLTMGNISRSYGLQMAPDSMIYHLYETAGGVFRLARIENPDTVASQTLYAPIPLGNQNYQGRQFSSFLPDFDPMLMVDFTFAGTCANVPTLFFPDITPSADSVVWDFGDSNGSNTLSPANTYENAGPFNVTLTAFLNGQSASAMHVVNIQAFDIQIQGIPQSDTVCTEDFPVTYTATASSGSPTFQWSNQTAPGATTTIDSAGNYYVIATDGTCEAYAPLQVVEYGAVQQQAFIWYFGDHAGLDFNPLVQLPTPGPVRPIPYGDPADFSGGNEMVAPEGAAIYCDQNGQPVFYSDGVNVYDREGNLVNPGQPIGGTIDANDASQSVFIVPFPNDATLFYIFTTKKVYDASGLNAYSLSYAVFDLKEKLGFGDLVRNGGTVVVTNLYTHNTERITGNGNWVIVHEYGNNNFRAYPITANGIGSPVISNVGSAHPTTTERTAQGYMKLGGNNQLAVALSISDTENYVEVFDFDPTTGAISMPLKLDFGVETGQVYGVEFSSDGRKLYASIKSPGLSKIYYWMIDTVTVTGNETDPDYIKTVTRMEVGQAAAELGALQMGPDGQIYVAKNGASALSTIGNSNGTFPIPNPNLPGGSFPNNPPLFTEDAQPLGANLTDGGSTLSTLGLPNFSDQFATAPSNIALNVNSGCLGDSLHFSVTNPISLEEYRWNIFDNTNTVVASGIGTDFSFLLTTPGAYTVRVDVIPECEVVGIPPNPGTAQFTISAPPAFTFENVMDASGCGADDAEFEMAITSIGDFEYSILGPTPFTNTVVSGPSVTPFTGLPAGIYLISLTDTLTGCNTLAGQEINEDAPFNIAPLAQDTDCDGLNGEIDITLTGLVTLPVNYVLRNISTGTVTTTGTDADGIINFSSLNTGTYGVEITDAAGAGCLQTANNIIVAIPNEATLNLPLEAVGCGVTQLDVTFGTSASTIGVTGPVAAIVNGNIITFTAPGTYTIDTQDGVQCNISRDIEIIFNDANENPFDPRYTICPEDIDPENTQVTLNPGTGFINTQYFDANDNPITSGTPGFTLQGNNLTVFIGESISAILTNPFGCETLANVVIAEDCGSKLNAPNAFTPNGDGNNDTFIIFPVLIAPEDFEIYIYNRWGELIFYSNEINFQWNGGYNNELNRPLPGGTFAYKINFRSQSEPEKGLQEQRGGVTLIR